MRRERRVLQMARRLSSVGFLRGGKGVVGLFEEAGDGVGRHFRLIVAKINTRARGDYFS